MITFQQLRTKADALNCVRGLGSRVDNVLDQARINADDTIYVEKTDDDWNRVALDTVRDILCYSNDDAVCAWFLGAGLKW